MSIKSGLTRVFGVEHENVFRTCSFAGTFPAAYRKILQWDLVLFFVLKLTALQSSSLALHVFKMPCHSDFQLVVLSYVFF